jgi:hypothetical protein
VKAFAVRDGVTAWRLSREHAGTAGAAIPLTENGHRLAEGMWLVVAGNAFALDHCSRMQRARGNCEPAIRDGGVLIDDHQAQSNYGEYGRLAPNKIYKTAPWGPIFGGGCRDSEPPLQVGACADQIIARRRGGPGGRRVIPPRPRAPGVGGGPSGLATGFPSGYRFAVQRGYYRDRPAVKVWNGPLLISGKA